MNALVEKEQSVTRIPQQPVPATLQMILSAVKSGSDIERIKELMILHERFEKREAEKAFNGAMAAFRSEAMVIYKSKWVDIPNGAKFFHAELANVCDAVIPNMSKYELYHKWIPKQRDDKMIEITCRISHSLGHFEDTTLFAPPDTLGNKSAIHAVASTVTLLERYTLLAAVGLAARGQDTNGAVPGSTTSDAKKPDDLDVWMADARALADEGEQRLKDFWRKSPEDIRRYIVTSEKSFWEDMKARAKKVDQKAKQS